MAVVGLVAFAGNQIQVAVGVEVCQRNGVGLTPRVVDRVLNPAPLAVFHALLIPENPIAVGQAGDDVVEPVRVDVVNADVRRVVGFTVFAADRQRVLLPLAGTRVLGRFEPCVGPEDVGPPVAVDVAGAHAPKERLRGDPMDQHALRPVRQLADFVPSRVCDGRQNLVAAAVPVDVPKVAVLEVAVDFHNMHGPLAGVGPGVLKPHGAHLVPRAGKDIKPPVAIDVHRHVHEVVSVAVTLGIDAAAECADLDRFEIRRQIQERPGHDVELPIAIEIPHAASLAAVVAEAMRFERRRLGQQRRAGNQYERE